MIMTFITLVFVGALTYLWVTRGFMSALIHMVCVIVAAAIAFGVWEPLGHILLNAAPQRGLGDFLGGMAWALALALPFAAVLALLRVGVDALLPANAQCDGIVDGIGGGVCGFVSAVISAGILVLSIGFLRVDPQFWGYTSLNYTTGVARGSLERPPGNFIPWVDRVTAGVYSHLSRGPFRTSTPLAVWHPDFDTFPASLRLNYDGVSRNTLKPDDFNVIGWYNVGDPQRPASLSPLLVDHWDPNPQRIMNIDGDPITSGYLTGLIVRFSAGARERGGYIAVGNGQIRLIVKREGEEASTALHPIAVITRVDDPRRIDYARFRFDSDNLFIASVGGEADAVMAFEFPVPAGYRPIGLYVKGVRYALPARTASQTFATVAERDRAVREGEFDGMGNVGPLTDEHGNPIQLPETFAYAYQEDPVRVVNALGFTIQKGTEGRGLTVSQAQRGWQIEEGEGRFNRAQVTRQGVDFNLQITRFSITQDTAMVQVDLSPGTRSLDFMNTLDRADPNGQPVLIDTNGRRYPAVGFVYEDGSLYHVRYTRGQPLRNLLDAPRVSRNTPDRKLRLLFTTSRGVQISELRIGGTLLEEFDPPLNTDLGF